MAATVRLFQALFCAVLVFAFAPAHTAFAKPAAVNIDDSGVAIGGYDPVAYFEMSKPVKGSPDFRASVDGVTYYFVSESHRQLFRQDPVQYIPEYGGYCAFGMRYGQTSSVDPHAWNIVDGRLYLLLNHGTREMWKDKRGENITIADKLWQSLLAEN